MEEVMINALALGSGGVKGIAHIALISELVRKRNIKFDIVTGCSAGSVVGGVYALNPSKNEFLKDFEAIIKKNSLKFIDLSNALSSKVNSFKRLLYSRGIAQNDLVYDILKQIYGKKRFSDCKIKFGVVAFDINSERLVEITEGYLIDAIMASSNVPGAFSPMRLGGMDLVDGGAISEVPVFLAKKLGGEYIIANDINPVRFKDIFSDGMDYMNYIDSFKTALITKNELDKADEVYTFSEEVEWYDFDKYFEIYRKAKRVYSRDIT